MDKGKNKLQRVINFIPKLAICVFGIYLTANFLFLVFLLPNWQHQLMKEFVQYNPIFFIFAIFICFTVFFINSKLIKINEWLRKVNLKKFILIGAIILLVFQLIIFFSKIFIAGWDVQKLFFTTEFDDLYFSQYPNNLFLKTFYGLFSKLFLITGASKVFMSVALSIFPWSNIANALTEQNAAEYVTYFFFVFINCLIINISVALTSLITNKLLNKKTAVLVYIFAFIFIGLNPWILVPYSDTLTLFNTTLILYIYICAKKKHFKWPIIFGITIIGFNIKPTTIFCLIAIIFIEICKWISRGSYKKNFNFKKITMQTGSIILACLLSFTFVNICKNTNNINIDENKEYTSTHFLMMGSNISSGGFYSDEDIQISSNCKSVKEREQKNIETFCERLNNMGFAGTITHYGLKSLVNYSDATFMWEMDAGPGFSVLTITNNSLIDNVFKNYGSVVQVLWFCILIGCCLIIFTKNNKWETGVICITLLVLSLFITIFECGARYLIQYLPYYIILSALGWSSFSAIMREKLICK